MRTLDLPESYRYTGAELDSEVASLRAGDARPYSTSITDAFLLWEEMRDNGQMSIMVQFSNRTGYYECCLVADSHRQGAKYVFSGFGDSACAAICSAYCELARAQVKAALDHKPEIRPTMKETELVLADGQTLVFAQDGNVPLLKVPSKDYANTGAGGSYEEGDASDIREGRTA